MEDRTIGCDERRITGAWLVENGKVRGDANCARIKWLTANYLRFLGSDDSGWERLYVDPSDNRYWVHTYPQGEMHGGGPPSLFWMAESEARAKFSRLFD
jgi:hypothetical protein